MYACALILRNSGHYTMVRTDFGSDYMTCRYISEESLYAGLTREETRNFGRIEPDMEATFWKAYEIPKRPIWFTPGMFVGQDLEALQSLPMTQMKYNVVDEAFPSTNKNTVFDKKGAHVIRDRANIATFGSIESVLPDQRVLTFAVSRQKELLTDFLANSVYMMGKKRTMFELLEVSEPVLLEEMEKSEEHTKTAPIQAQMRELNQFFSYTIHEVNARHFLVEGTAAKAWRLEYELLGERRAVCVPDLFVQRAEWLFDLDIK